MIRRLQVQTATSEAGGRRPSLCLCSEIRRKGCGLMLCPRSSHLALRGNRKMSGPRAFQKPMHSKTLICVAAHDIALVIDSECDGAGSSRDVK